jgi:cyanophycinase
VPAPVPPGFTRGPIMFIGHTQATPAETSLFQRLWNEAGGYGARILLVPTASDQAAVDRFTQLFKAWEVDALDVLPVRTRSDAQQTAQLELIDHATAILILDGQPLTLARTLGGTPVAQAIRRANARNKVVCGVGYGANILCQHMLLFEHQQPVQFAPGLGLINRMAIAVQTEKQMPALISASRLLAAIGYNPFLIGVSLDIDTGVVVYPDTTLEVFGAQTVLVVDGANMLYPDLPDLPADAQLSELGVQVHRLEVGATFNFDQRTVLPPLQSDIPATAVPVQSKSPF